MNEVLIDRRILSLMEICESQSNKIEALEERVSEMHEILLSVCIMTLMDQGKL